MVQSQRIRSSGTLFTDSRTCLPESLVIYCCKGKALSFYVNLHSRIGMGTPAAKNQFCLNLRLFKVYKFHIRSFFRILE